MASEPAIKVDGLGKRYLIRHEARPDTLRDTLAHGTRDTLRRLIRGNKPPDNEEFWALRDVSFEVGRGEVVGIIGRNGAGKSTLLKILSRITESTAGSVEIDGRVASLLEVGTGFHPELTGRENVFLNGVMLGMSRAEIGKKFDEIVSFAEVERFLDTPVKHYSSGMYVRLAFAVAAHVEPDILIVDEVLAVGDFAFQAKCLGKIESISQQAGRTILFVSHNMSAIARFCQRSILLSQGRLEFQGPTESAIRQYVGPAQSVTGTEIKLRDQGYVPGASVEMLSITLNDGQPLVNREPFKATIRVRSSQPRVICGFGLGFCSIDGRRILTSESDYDGKFLTLDRPGEYRVALDIPILDLIPGQYRIDIGVFNDSHVGFHYEPDCAIVEVHAGAGTPAHLHGVNGDWRPRYSWSVAGAQEA